MSIYQDYMKRFQKHPMLFGTFLLTIASILTRIIGFLFRIFLTKEIGAEGFGIYQLTLPIILTSHALCVSGFEIAITQMVSKYKCSESARMRRVLYCGLSLSIAISAVVALILYIFKYSVANCFLAEPRCEGSFFWFLFILPASAIHGCIYGFYLGKQDSKLPAISVLVEQLARVSSVYIITVICHANHISFDYKIAVAGTAIGEITSVCLCIFWFLSHEKISIKKLTDSAYIHDADRNLLSSQKNCFLSSVLFRAIPISLNQLLVSLLSSIQSILVPLCLIQYGCSRTEALSQYGLMLGLVMPLLVFPGAFIQSASQMLVPNISQANAQNKTKKMTHTAKLTIRFSILFGLVFTLIFLFFGTLIGTYILQNESCSIYIMKLAFLCPFLYATTTLSGILYGLDCSSLILKFNLIASAIKILLTVLLIPRIGIDGFIFSQFAGSIMIFLSHYQTTRKKLFNSNT